MENSTQTGQTCKQWRWLMSEAIDTESSLPKSSTIITSKWETGNLQNTITVSENHFINKSAKKTLEITTWNNVHVILTYLIVCSKRKGVVYEPLSGFNHQWYIICIFELSLKKASCASGNGHAILTPESRKLFGKEYQFASKYLICVYMYYNVHKTVCKSAMILDIPVPQ